MLAFILYAIISAYTIHPLFNTVKNMKEIVDSRYWTKFIKIILILSVGFCGMRTIWGAILPNEPDDAITVFSCMLCFVIMDFCVRGRTKRKIFAWSVIHITFVFSVGVAIFTFLSFIPSMAYIKNVPACSIFFSPLVSIFPAFVAMRFSSRDDI